MEYTKKIFNMETGEETIIEMSEEEIAQAVAAHEAANAKKVNHRAEALAKLAALGLTEDEIAAL